MASIRIAELRPAGSELFQDSESFLNELSENREIDQIMGGRYGVRSFGNTFGNEGNGVIQISVAQANSNNNNANFTINQNQFGRRK